MERSGSYLPLGHNGSRRSHNPLFLSEQSKQQQHSCELNLAGADPPRDTEDHGSAGGG